MKKCVNFIKAIRPNLSLVYNQIFQLQNALESLGLFDSAQERIFQIMAGILELGNIEFRDYRDQATILDLEVVDEAARLLSIKSKTLITLLTEKSSKIGRANGRGGETLTRRHNVPQGNSYI